MKKYEMIKSKIEFDNIIHNCPYLKNDIYIIYYKEKEVSYPRFGLAVGKKLGSAVNRNKIKRQLRMIINNNKNLFKNNLDYIIIVKNAFIDLKYDMKEKKLIKLIKEMGE